MLTASSQGGSHIRYLWSLRVPIISGSILVGLPFLAFRPAARSFLSGLFDPIDNLALILITTLALFNAWTSMIIASLILTYGGTRFDLPNLAIRFFPVRKRVWFLGGLLAVPTVGRTIWYTASASNHNLLTIVFCVGAGIVVAAGMLSLSLTISGKLNREDSSNRRRLAGSWLGQKYRQWLDRLGGWPALGSGFVEERRNGKFELAAGHGLALGLACSSVLLYLAAGFLTRDVQRPVVASALAYVLLLMLMLTWLVGFLAFVFDRGGLPLSLLLAIWILVVNLVLHPIFSTDHIYRTVEASRDAPALAPTAALLPESEPSIVVAASGGGIEAAAWTARVLTSMQSIPGFDTHLRLISGVSGGSVGTMYVVAGLPECGPPRADQSSDGAAFRANDAVRESSLHAVGWGLVFKDLPRTIAPFLSTPYVDRGSVLEDAWKREARLKREYPDPEPFLASWRRNVADHRCPAVVYNAMVAESGDPMLFATVGLPSTLAAFDFYARYPGRDLPVTTAVRLSASFPYVSPAARADVDDDRRGYTHIVDGGYFDNYGVSSLAAIVHAALSSLPRPIDYRRRVLIVEICDSPRCSGDDPPAKPSMGGADRGWPYQITAPLSAVVAMRSAAQRTTNRTTLRLLKDYWRSRGTCIESIPVPLDEGDTAMSWHLTAVEKRAIDHAWNTMESRTLTAVTAFLMGEAPTDEGRRCLSE